MFAWVLASPHFLKLFRSCLVEKLMKQATRCCASRCCVSRLKNHAFCRLPFMGAVLLEWCCNWENNAKLSKGDVTNASLLHGPKVVQKRLFRASTIDPKSQNFEQQFAGNLQNGKTEQVSKASSFKAKNERKQAEKKGAPRVALCADFHRFRYSVFF